MRIVNALVVLLLLLVVSRLEALYYDGVSSYSIYPRLDMQLCTNNSLSFDFTISSSSIKYGHNNSSSQQSIRPNDPRLLIYAEQQLQYGHNAHFMIKLADGDSLIISDYWHGSDIVFKLPADYKTSWFRFVYTRVLATADISVYKFEVSPKAEDKFGWQKLIRLFSKQLVYTNFVRREAVSHDAAYSQLLVGGIDDNYSAGPLANVANFHGYIMNLKYISDHSSQCSVNDVCLNQDGERHYAIFSSSSSKRLKLKHSLIMNDICESDTLTHDMCPRECSCLSNNFQAPYFSCDCKKDPYYDSEEMGSDEELAHQQHQCKLLFRSFKIDFDDENYFAQAEDTFEYPILPSFTKISVNKVATKFNKLHGIEFDNPTSAVNLKPATSDSVEADNCFWDVESCLKGFVQHMVLSIDYLDETKFDQKVVIFSNSQPVDKAASNAFKLVAYIYNNQLHFAIYKDNKKSEWHVKSPSLTADGVNYLNRPLKVI